MLQNPENLLLRALLHRSPTALQAPRPLPSRGAVEGAEGGGPRGPGGPPRSASPSPASPRLTWRSRQATRACLRGWNVARHGGASRRSGAGSWNLHADRHQVAVGHARELIRTGNSICVLDFLVHTSGSRGDDHSITHWLPLVSEEVLDEIDMNVRPRLRVLATSPRVLATRPPCRRRPSSTRSRRRTRPRRPRARSSSARSRSTRAWWRRRRRA